MARLSSRQLPAEESSSTRPPSDCHRLDRPKSANLTTVTQGVSGSAPPPGFEAAADPQHPAVLAQDMAEDFAHASSSGVIDQAMHQQSAETSAGHIVAHGQGELRLLIVGIGGDAADGVELGRARAAVFREHEGHLAIVVDLSEPRRRLVGQPGRGRRLQCLICG